MISLSAVVLGVDCNTPRTGDGLDTKLKICGFICSDYNELRN
jgi:hypothetical protein